MGLALLIVGLLMVITGARGTYSQLASQLASEFQGQGNFAYWIIAIVAVGSIGYIPSLQKISRYVLALIILSIFLSHKGFFAQFNAALKKGPVQPGPVAQTSTGQQTGNPVVNSAIPGAGTIANFLTGKSFFGITFGQ